MRCSRSRNTLIYGKDTTITLCSKCLPEVAVIKINSAGIVYFVIFIINCVKFCVSSIVGFFI